ncbi:AbrB/MazE/SpoVT family DNA-binding domain-containing protein [Haladaptatus halobius]|uniref:AbrB/MazE/SpoVT family DNA-binding domain-containing protein n=1 Tax=Haladaptatus halobius TaxID=2884875 RepID=UPI001D0B1396|nr:AbrB/MazE/SpoVT family DNA-binding domain-containing protein [Haladaptatus halobius]
MTGSTVDDRGRLYLPKDVREKYGDQYRIVRLESGIKLVRVADDPLEALREEFSDIEKSASELLEDAREDALHEAGK